MIVEGPDLPALPSAAQPIPTHFSADMDRPLPECHCRSCESEDLYPPSTDCLFYRKVEWS